MVLSFLSIVIGCSKFSTNKSALKWAKHKIYTQILLIGSAPGSLKWYKEQYWPISWNSDDIDYLRSSRYVKTLGLTLAYLQVNRRLILYILAPYILILKSSTTNHKMRLNKFNIPIKGWTFASSTTRWLNYVSIFGQLQQWKLAQKCNKFAKVSLLFWQIWN